jgi:hypothetical protein
MDPDTVVVVSGLPRSGTSMMMKMLEAGGMQVLTDEIRTADEDNPKGYYEFERVKQIESDQGWLPDAQGKAVKMVGALLQHLPSGHLYRIIFMQRKMEEVLASQHEMLIRRGQSTDRISDEKMGALFHKHVEKVKSWIAERPDMEVLYVHYGDVLEEPARQAERVNRFLGSILDVDKMASVVDQGLYRKRA